MVFVLFILLVLDMEVRKDEKFVDTLHIVSITCNNEVCLLEYNKKSTTLIKKATTKSMISYTRRLLWNTKSLKIN